MRVQCPVCFGNKFISVINRKFPYQSIEDCPHCNRAGDMEEEQATALKAELAIKAEIKRKNAQSKQPKGNQHD